MVAHTHHIDAGVTRCSDRSGRRDSRCAIRVHTLLMQKVYKNILVLIVGFCVLHLVFQEKTTWFLVVALVVLMLSAVSQTAAVYIEKGWLWFGEKIGRVNAAIILFLVYYLVLTPIAFISNFGKDPLRLKAPEKSNFDFKHHKYSAKDLENPW
jgi:hypothetical protein